MSNELAYFAVAYITAPRALKRAKQKYVMTVEHVQLIYNLRFNRSRVVWSKTIWPTDIWSTDITITDAAMALRHYDNACNDFT